MRHHAFYPTAYPTVQPRRVLVLRALRYLLVSMVVICMSALTTLVILKLSTIDAQLNSAFMQGMTAGAQFCPRGT